MNFGQAIASGFSNYVNFSSRACRSEYWFWVLFVVLAQIATSIVDMALGVSVTSSLFGLATFLPSLALGVRRLHDLDRTGWWLLLVLIPAHRRHHPDRLVLHQGHRGAEPLRPGSADGVRRADQPAASNVTASSRPNR